MGSGGRVLSFPLPVKKSLWVGTRPSLQVRECGALLSHSSQDLVLSKNQVKSHSVYFSVSVGGYFQEYQEQNLISFVFAIERLFSLNCILGN